MDTKEQLGFMEAAQSQGAFAGKLEDTGQDLMILGSLVFGIGLLAYLSGKIYRKLKG